MLRQSQEDERRHIARELHDDTVQSLISVARRIELLQDSTADADQRQKLADLRSMVADSANRVRGVALGLRPPVLEDLGLINALSMLANSRSTNGAGSLEITLTINGTPAPLEPELELTLFRIAQEAINNVHKHAQASHAQMHLEYLESWLRLSVSDNGVGFEIPTSFTELVQRRSLGLIGIRERVWGASGKMEIVSELGAGSQLQVTIPITTPPMHALAEESISNSQSQ